MPRKQFDIDQRILLYLIWKVVFLNSGNYSWALHISQTRGGRVVCRREGGKMIQVGHIVETEEGSKGIVTRKFAGIHLMENFQSGICRACHRSVYERREN